MRIPRSKRALRGRARPPAVLLATIVGFLLIGACAAVEAGVVAAFGHDGSEAGIVLAIFSDRLARRRPVPRPRSDRAVGDRAPRVHRVRRRRARRVRHGLLVARGHALHRRHRHRTRAGRAVRHRVGEREVQRHRRGLRLGRHRPAHRRRARVGARRIPHRRLRRPGRVLGGDRRSRSSASSRASLGRPWHPDLRGRDASPIPDTEPVPLQPS